MWYEVHISVNERPGGTGSQWYDDALANAKKLEELCAKIDAKVLLIELSSGADHPFHLMVTQNKLFEGNAQNKESVEDADQKAKTWAIDLRETVTKAGWHVERMKLEAQMGEGPGEYYEAHWRVKFLGASCESEKVAGFVKRYPQFKHSWNLLNRDKRYFTARYYEYDPSSAQKYFQELTNLLQASFKITKTETERVITDTNPQFDRGWAYVDLKA
jgi:hypothetical protein